jgi:hypothetical protein
MSIGVRPSGYSNPGNRSSSGIKIVDDNPNKKNSDIFNLRKVVTYQNSSMNSTYKKRMIEVTEKIIDDKMRSSTPYWNGHRNANFTPMHMNNSDGFTLDVRPKSVNHTPAAKSIPDKMMKSSFTNLGFGNRPIPVVPVKAEKGLKKSATVVGYNMGPKNIDDDLSKGPLFNQNVIIE